MNNTGTKKGGIMK